MDIADKRLKNLKPWKKGEAPKTKSPGRPKKLDWQRELNDFASTPSQRLPLLKRLLKKKPDVAMYYLAGKPMEQIRIEADIAQRIEPGTIEVAIAAAKKLLSAPS